MTNRTKVVFHPACVSLLDPRETLPTEVVSYDLRSDQDVDDEGALTNGCEAWGLLTLSGEPISPVCRNRFMVPNVHLEAEATSPR